MGYALRFSLVEHVDDLFDDEPAGLTGGRGQSETDGLYCLWLAFTANFFRHQFQQVCQVEAKRAAYAFGPFGGGVLLPSLTFTAIISETAGLVPSFLIVKPRFRPL